MPLFSISPGGSVDIIRKETLSALLHLLDFCLRFLDFSVRHDSLSSISLEPASGCLNRMICVCPPAGPEQCQPRVLGAALSIRLALSPGGRGRSYADLVDRVEACLLDAFGTILTCAFTAHMRELPVLAGIPADAMYEEFARIVRPRSPTALGIRTAQIVRGAPGADVPSGGTKVIRSLSDVEAMLPA